MPVIGVRELCERTAEVLRRVREEQGEYLITHQGRPVAMLLPIDQEAIEAAMIESGKQTAVGGWEIYSRMAERMRQTWPADHGTEATLRDIRRD